MSELAGHLEEKKPRRGILETIRDIANASFIDLGVEAASIDGAGLSPNAVSEIKSRVATGNANTTSAQPQEMPYGIEVQIQNPGLFEDTGQAL